MRINKFLSLFVFLGLTLNAQSQNLGLSSYSRIGIGDLVSPGSSRNMGMGGAGVASYHQFQLSALNPASLAALKYTNLEFIIAGKGTKYTTLKEGSQTGLSSNIQFISLSLPIHKRFLMQIGARPFSSVSYNESDSQRALDQNNEPAGNRFYNYKRTGYGGLSDLFIGAAYNYKDWLMLGLNGGLILGQSVHENQVTETINLYNTSVQQYEQHLRLSPGIIITKELKRRTPRLIITDSTVIVQDSVLKPKTIEVVPVNNNWYYSLGLTGSFYRLLQAQEERFFNQETFAGNNANGAALYYRNADTISSQRLENYALPSSFTAGISFFKPNRITLVLDYSFAKWSLYTHNQYMSVPKDQHGVALGAEIIPDFNSIKYLKRIAYRAGLNVKQLPYEIAGQSLSEMQASIGAGLVFPKSGVSLNLSLAYGQRGTTASNLVKEDYFLATLGVISNNKWFVRRRHE